MKTRTIEVSREVAVETHRLHGVIIAQQAEIERLKCCGSCGNLKTDEDGMYLCRIDDTLIWQRGKCDKWIWAKGAGK